jgi:F0F1-type ATP synthase delta subunit
MTEGNPYDAIISSLSVRDDVLRFNERLSAVIDNLYSTRETLSDTLAANFSHEKKAAIEAILAAEHVPLSDPAALQRALEKIKSTLLALPVLEIAVAAEITEEGVKTIRDWVLTNTGKGTLLEIRIKPEIVAGVQLSLNGMYKDYSIAKHIDTVLQAQPHQTS